MQLMTSNFIIMLFNVFDLGELIMASYCLTTIMQQIGHHHQYEKKFITIKIIILHL